MQKNVATKLIVFAWDATTGLPKTGDAANLTAYYDLDFGGVMALTDTSASEIDSTNAKGYYQFDVAQAENNGNAVLFTAKSSTSNIVVVAVPAMVFTTAPNFANTVISSGGTVNADAKAINAVATTSVTTVSANQGTTQPVNFTGTGGSAKVLVDVDTIKTNAVINGGTITFPTNATLASTTNITAGVITTATNLTNAPTSGDFTSTMKTSLNNSTPASVTTVTGNVNGNVGGTVGSVTTPVYIAADALDMTYLTVDYGSVTASTGTTVSYSTNKITTPAALVGATVLITSDDGSDLRKGQPRIITAASDAGGGVYTLTVDHAWNVNPTSGGPDRLAIWAFGVSDLRTTRGTSSVGAAGYIGLDWGQVTNKTTTNALTGTTVSTSQVVASITGNLGGNVTGSVGSLATQAKTDVENATWDAVLADHLDAGSTGFALNAASSAGDPWGTSLPGAYGAGTAGFILGTNLNATVSSRAAASTALSTVQWTNTRAGYLDNLSGGAVALAATALSTVNWPTLLATNLTTLASHDPGSTIAAASSVSTANVALVKVQAAVYDSNTSNGTNVLTLSNAATLTFNLTTGARTQA